MESWTNNEGNKNHVATRFLLSTQIPIFSKNTRKTLDAVAVSFLPMTSFHSPRIQTAHCGFIASVFLVFDSFIFLCTSSQSTLVLMQGLCILVLKLLLYFCSQRRKVKCPAVEMLDVQLKSINIYIYIYQSCVREFSVLLMICFAIALLLILHLYETSAVSVHSESLARTVLLVSFAMG